MKFWISVLIVSLYMLHCLRIGTRPCKYFQLNVDRFDADKGIFSKIAIDRSIPDEWRLDQRYDDGAFMPDQWPVFLKPEWGQNAAGVKCARNPEELRGIRGRIRHSRIRYLVQAPAPEPREFEVFSIRHHEDPERYAVLTVTETLNDSEEIPINGVFNPNSRYRDLTDDLDGIQKERLWAMSNRLGTHVICRACYRAESLADLVAGRVHVIEVNLYLPMPINLLDRGRPAAEILVLVNRYMLALARATKTREGSRPEKPVFTKINLYNRKSPLLNYFRDRI